MKIGLVGESFHGSSMPFHQTFNSLGKTSFATFTNYPDESCDYIVTFGVIPRGLPDWWTSYPKNRKVAVLHENPLIYLPPADYFDMHDHLISPAAPTGFNHLHWIPSHSGVPWFYGVEYKTDKGTSHVKADIPPMRLEFLVARRPPTKTKCLSFITSTKSGLPGYDFRLRLAVSLKNRFGDDIDVFGFGHNAISSKEHALDSYQYTVVIENSFISNYWTEKLSDAYLGYATPIYAGAPNIQDYFDHQINIIKSSNVDEAVSEIVKIVSRSPSESSMYSNRNKIMFSHNVFYLLEQILLRL
jgi:hypothetical protein